MESRVGEAQSNLQDAIGRIRSRWGAAALTTHPEVDGGLATGVATGIVELDGLTAVGGVPAGRVSLLLGAGGLDVAERLLARATQAEVSLLVDFNGHADPWLLARLGADLDRLLIIGIHPGHPDTGLRDCLDAVLALVRSGVRCVVVDLPPAVAVDPTWDIYAPLLASACSRADAVLVVVAAAAGAPLRHASSLSLRCLRQSWWLTHGDLAGVRLTVEVEKSKVPVLHPRASFTVAFPRGAFLPPPLPVAKEASEVGVAGAIRMNLLNKSEFGPRVVAAS